MASHVRRLLVGLVCLGAVLAVFVFYNRFSKTVPIDTGVGSEFGRAVEDFNSEIGTIGQVGVAKAERARYETYDPNTGQLEQIFGFDRLLEAQDNEWQLDKPRIDIFRSRFNCRVTAETGLVQIEEGPTGPKPIAGKLTGNVVVRIVPTGSGKVKESFIYLDDMVFVSERSQLSTAGPVKFVSEDVRILGTGLELVYDGEAERLEYLRLVDLKWMRAKSARTNLLGPAKAEKEVASSLAGPTETKAPSPAPAVSQTVREPKIPTTPDPKPAKQKPPVWYRSVFMRNVVVDTPKELIVAEDRISINDILWQDTSNETAAKIDKDKPTSEKAAQETVDVVGVKPRQADANRAKTPVSAPYHEDRPAKPAQEQFDIEVTCDNGFVMMAVDCYLSLDDLSGPGGRDSAPTDKASVAAERAGDRTTLTAKEIDHSAKTEETVVTGPLKLTFYPNDVTIPGSNETAAGTVPVTVTAAREARFLPDSNQVIFNGDCVCTMQRDDPNGRQTHKLSAPTLTVDLLEQDRQQQSVARSRDIKHLTAAGGTVRLTSEKTVQEARLSAVELECRQFDFYGVEQMFLATGPGVIEIDNSNVPDPNSQPDPFSFRKRSYAMVEDFDTLQFFMDSGRFVADGKTHQVRLGYIPLIEDKPGAPVRASAGHIEGLLAETTDDEYELSTLDATGGVTYEDKDKKFEGDTLAYDAGKSLVTVSGDCYFNDVPVDAIEWDPQTDKIIFQVTGIGVAQPEK
ncbi:MAG: hypothetical protein ACYTEL_10505 [Planctomycetota bacterium]|jgi:lipopolysaccharide export system protein LptC